MKKIYTTQEFIALKKRRDLASVGRKKKRKLRPKYFPSIHAVTPFRRPSDETYLLSAPEDFRLIDNPEKCLAFFREIRKKENYSKEGRGDKFLRISLRNVKYIDYATISLLTAISDDLQASRINLRGDFPNDPTCQSFLRESGFLDHMVDEFNQKFPKAKQSKFIFFEKGSGILSARDNKNISEMVKNVVDHLTGRKDHFNPVKSILLEICGNSIEHAGTVHKQWLLGVLFHNDSVIFTVTDVGKGILETLYKKFHQRVFSTFQNDHDVLMGAFDQKYGSRTKEENRNKGLPAIKQNFGEGKIRSLKVLTNNVILHFDHSPSSKTFRLGSPRFHGTLFQWEITKECLKKTETPDGNL